MSCPLCLRSEHRCKCDETPETVESEQGRWQLAILELLRKRVPYPDGVDGSVCDSGDPLDVTLADINLALVQIEGQRDEAIARADAAEKRALEIGRGPGSKWWADGYKEVKAQLDLLNSTLPMQDPRRMAKRIRMQRREIRRLLAFVDHWSKSHCKQAAYLRLRLNRAEAEVRRWREEANKLQKEAFREEQRADALEGWIADHEFEAEEYDTLAGRRISVCPVCGGHGGHHTHGLNQPCPWGQAAANHRARTSEVKP